MKRIGSFTVMAVSMALILGLSAGFMFKTALDAKQNSAANKCASAICSERTKTVSNNLGILMRDPFMDQQLALLRRLDNMQDMRSLSFELPKIQTVDSGKNVVVVAQVPSLNKGDFDVQVKNNVLTISAQNKNEQKTQGKNQNFVQFFNESIQLPCAVDGSKATTSIKDNQMTIMIPKSNTAA